MKATTKRACWTAVAGAGGLFGFYTVASLDPPSRFQSLVWHLCSIAIAAGLVRIGRRFPTRVRQEWDLGWGRHITAGILVAAITFPILHLIRLIALGESTFEATLQATVGSVSLGLILGAMVGCGGVLGIAEDTNSQAKRVGSSEAGWASAFRNRATRC
jgi:hypothetical protein